MLGLAVTSRALPLDENGRFFDASEYTGVRLWCLGNGEMYHVHIRTSRSRRPWQYYSAEFGADGEWTRVNHDADGEPLQDVQQLLVERTTRRRKKA